nr:protein rough sheath 2 homolog [Tanacetum cinerariifolium]
MKDRQRWQPEEDALLRAYVHQYGPKEWNLISHRMSKPLDRDPKSCLERWKNYLKPGIKKGSLTPQEQSLVISLQAKYGNKWKKIASEVPGRTAKRLGKWWEVFKEKQLKQQLQNSKKNIRSSGSDISTLQGNNNTSVGAVSGEPEKAVQGTYDHILETFAEKYVQPYLNPSSVVSVPVPVPVPVSLPIPVPVMPNLNSPILSLGSGVGAGTSSAPDSMVATTLPPWMNSNSGSSSTSKSTTPSPSVSLTLSPSEPVVLDPVQVQVQPDHPVHSRFLPVQHVGTLVQYCKEVEEAKQNWVQHKKEATWRLNRLEQQLEAEKNRKRREKMEEIEAKIRSLREEETAALGRVEHEYREQLTALQRDAEGKEMKLMEAWSNKQMKLSNVVEQINGGLIQHQHMISVSATYDRERGWGYIGFYDAKVSIKSKLHLLQTIRAKLSWNEDRLGMCTRSVFGPWFVHNPSPNQPFIFDIDGRSLEFGREDLCLITGFRFGKYKLDPKEEAHSEFYSKRRKYHLDKLASNSKYEADYVLFGFVFPLKVTPSTPVLRSSTRGSSNSKSVNTRVRIEVRHELHVRIEVRSLVHKEEVRTEAVDQEDLLERVVLTQTIKDQQQMIVDLQRRLLSVEQVTKKLRTGSSDVDHLDKNGNQYDNVPVSGLDHQSMDGVSHYESVAIDGLIRLRSQDVDHTSKESIVVDDNDSKDKDNEEDFF